MTPSPHVLVPFDGSVAAKRAADYAASLTARLGARLSFAHVQPPVGSVVELKASDAEGEAMMSAIAAAYPSAKTRPSIIIGHDIACAICDCFPDAIVVVGSDHAARYTGVEPSIAEALIRSAHDHPILVVGPQARRPAFDGPVAVALDGSPLAEAALLPALAWARAFGTRVQLVQVTPPAPDADVRTTSDYLVSVRALAKAGATPADIHHVIDPDPVAGLVRHLTEHDCSLVAIATHARESFDRLALGSVTMGLIAQSPCTVCAVHPDAPPAAALPPGSAEHAQLVPRHQQ